MYKTGGMKGKSNGAKKDTVGGTTIYTIHQKKPRMNGALAVLLPRAVHHSTRVAGGVQKRRPACCVQASLAGYAQGVFQSAALTLISGSCVCAILRGALFAYDSILSMCSK